MKKLLQTTPVLFWAVSKLIEMLASFKGNSLAGIQYLVDARLKRKGAIETYFDSNGNQLTQAQAVNYPYLGEVETRTEVIFNPFAKGEIVKRVRATIQVGFKYYNSLANQAKREEKEISFKKQPRRWGTRRPDAPLVDHLGKVYLECMFIKVHEVAYFDLEGNEVSLEDIELFLPKKKESATQDELEKKVILRDVNVANIERFAFDGNIYKILVE